MIFIHLALVPYKLHQSLTGRRRTARELRRWAEEQGMEIAVLKARGTPPYSVSRQFPPSMIRADSITRGLLSNFRYFQITVIGADHVRYSGVARVANDGGLFFDGEPTIDFVWSASDQLNWKDRPPRRSAESPPAGAEGWYFDHTGVHELRWYSVGTPTDLVKDGRIESRDPPDRLSGHS